MNDTLTLIDGERVLVDADLLSKLSHRRWQRMGGRIVSVSDPSFRDIADLATTIAGPGAFAGSPRDYRRCALSLLRVSENGRVDVQS